MNPFRKFVIALIFASAALTACTDENSVLPDAITMVKTYGGDSLDFAVQIMATADDHYLILGRTNSFGLGKTDAYLLKVNKQGNKVWDGYYGGTDYDDAQQMVATPDGGYLIVGSTLSFGMGGMDMMLIKTDGNGKQQFFKTYGDIYYDNGKFISHSGDGNYLIGGYSTTRAHQRKDMALIKINPAGEELWKRTYDFDSTDVANGMVVEDDGFLIYGKSLMEDKSQNITLVKTDFSGNVLWSKHHGGEGVDEIVKMIVAADGTYIGSGYTGSIYENRNNDLYVVSFDAQGDTIRTNHFGSSNQWDYEEGYAIINASGGGYYLSGRKRSAMWVMKLDQNFQQVWEQDYGDTYYYATRVAFDLLEEPDGKIAVVGGETDSEDGDIVFLRLDPAKAR
ncbi:MAG: hypothetical protein U5L09_14055 [Bacteroidales bacterium]|nr:hypothetical protein [Bacteroidales bacterium]